MYPRTEYEMTEEDLAAILDACKPTPVMMIGGFTGSPPQENANRAWAVLGTKMGFDPMTVQPISGRGQRFFTAIPSEPEDQRLARLAREAENHRHAEIAQLRQEIDERQKRITELEYAEPTDSSRG